MPDPVSPDYTSPDQGVSTVTHLCEMAEHGLCDQPAENVSTIPMAGHRPKYLLCHDHLVEFGWAIEESEAFDGA